MIHRPFAILSLLSALLCIGIVASWVWSYRAHHVILRTTLPDAWQVSSLRGKVWLFELHFDTGSPRGAALGIRRPSLWDAEDDAAVERFHFDRYPAAAPDAGQRARNDFDASRSTAQRAARFYDQVQDGIDAGNTKWTSILSWVKREHLTTMQDARRAWARWQAAAAPERTTSRLGFHWSADGAEGSRFIAVPYWALFVSTAALPAGRVLLWRRARRRAHAGYCRACGYDLRASGERCPECGTAIPTPASVDAGKIDAKTV